MNKQLTLYIVLLIIVTGIIIGIDSSKPKPIDWTPSYDIKEKSPLGLFIFNEEAERLFKGQKIEKFNITPYEFFDAKFDYDAKKYNADGTFIAISKTNEIDPESIEELMYFAEHGNTVFLSMERFPYTLLDTLKIELESHHYIQDTLLLSINNSTVSKPKKYIFKEATGLNYFSSIDTLTTAVLGHQFLFEKEYTNYISVPFGDGKFLLHTQPVAFSNFYLLKENNHEYAEKALGYIPEKTIYWNTGSLNNERISGSPLRFILDQPALNSAFLLALLIIVIFIIFNAKRKQRIIPEIAPLKNTTVDFTKTIGNLYYQEGNHHTIIEKKIIYLLEKIRSEYLIDTYSLDDIFIEKLHLKTGNTVEDIQKTVHLIKKHRHQFESTEADVIEINKAIEKLKL
ncbi:MAG: hypothetical protein BM557_08780 [Flavobacterium sp. MedPE-SWcel]|uniref:DUF4350 domain-containing protein n=1 Tax=uncultured Flavobacterium sp. TaxID=165435 RepID=UPI00091269EC|nr:DUF4350 domain-containing protein [uncultured Flavobacterium sp.]OIQ17296.1 MAG: hypothetical protein BM557_08780 [Flavobacterium sp. MedPE-SWcel]